MVSNEIQAIARKGKKNSTKAEFYNTKYHVKCGKVHALPKAEAFWQKKGKNSHSTNQMWRTRYLMFGNLESVI